MSKNLLINSLHDLFADYTKEYGENPDIIRVTRLAFARLFQVEPINTTTSQFKGIPIHIITPLGVKGNLFLSNEKRGLSCVCQVNADSIVVLSGLPFKQYKEETMSKDSKSTYYDVGGIEVMDIIKAKLTSEQYKGFLLGSALKYLLRANFKHNTPDRDFEKANNMIQWLAENEIKIKEKEGEEEDLLF